MGAGLTFAPTISQVIRLADAQARIRRAQAADHSRMLALWEASVRATHAFLTEQDIQNLRPDVMAGFQSAALEWWVVCDAQDVPMGFLGYTPGCVEGLFVDPAFHRRGLGRLLLAHAQNLARGPLRLDVNEGNPGAIAFYEAQGFTAVGRSPTDGEGRPFPLVHMVRETVVSDGAEHR
jgi:putative acetyltransferase